MPFTTKLVVSRPTLLYGAQGSNPAPVQVRNTDSANTVWVGDVSNVSTDGSNSAPLGPGDSVSFDGSVSIYAVTASGVQVIVALIPGGVSFAPGIVDISGPVTASISGPVDVQTPAPIDVSAATVNISGVGGFVLPGELSLSYNNVAAVQAPASGSNQIGPGTFDVTKFASLLFTANGASNSSTANGAAVCSQWVFAWQDSASHEIAIDIISCLMGASVTVQLPVKGSKVAITLENLGTVGTISYTALDTVLVWGDYRQISKPIVASYVFPLVPPVISGYTVINPNPAPPMPWVSSFLGSGLAANTQYLIPFSMWYGDVAGWYQQAGQALANDPVIVDLTSALQGTIPVGTSYPNGMLQNLPEAIQASPVNISYNSPVTQQALTLKTGASVGTTFLMLSGK